MAKAILVEEQQWYYLTHNWGIERVHIFPKGISSKVNLIVQLVFKLTTLDAGLLLTSEHAIHHN